MPSFRQAKFLPAALASVFGQEFPELEFQVRDGGSEDGSVDLLRQAEAAGRAFTWISGPDGGQAAAINAGLAGASGEIFGFLNSDDVLLPGALNRVSAHFEREPSCQVLYGEAWHLAEDGSVAEIYPTEDWDYARLQEVCFLCQPAVFWRREVWERFGPLDATLHYALDYEYWLRVGRELPFQRLGGPPLAGSRLHAGTKTLRARVAVHRECLQVVQRHGGSETAVVKWLRALADCRLQARPTLPRWWRLRAAWHTMYLLAEAWSHGVRLGPALRRELRRALGGRARWEAFQPAL